MSSVRRLALLALAVTIIGPRWRWRATGSSELVRLEGYREPLGSSRSGRRRWSDRRCVDTRAGLAWGDAGRLDHGALEPNRLLDQWNPRSPRRSRNTRGRCYGIIGALIGLASESRSRLALGAFLGALVTGFLVVHPDLREMVHEGGGLRVNLLIFGVVAIP
jgi:hypothetical protein